ncbi:hypothetical protein SLA2020_027780 [Shorea laevis]
MRVIPGLSAYASDPESAGLSIMGLLEFGKGTVPKELWAETEIRLMATAGLRPLDIGVQDEILESCRRVLRASGFKFHDDWASVITGILPYDLLFFVVSYPFVVNFVQVEGRECTVVLANIVTQVEKMEVSKDFAMFCQLVEL